MASLIEHVPPHDSEAEQAVIGSILVNQEVMPLVSRLIGPASFYHKRHELIFAAMHDITERGENLDPIIIRDELGAKLEAAGGYFYLVQLAGMLPTAAFAEQYARIVADKALLRSLQRFGVKLAEKAIAAEEEARMVYEAAMGDLLAIQSGRVSRMESVQEIGSAYIESLMRRMESGKALHGCLTTGIYNLDQRITPAASDLVILAARPAMGKTSLALNWAQHVATYAPVHIYSLEMSKEQLFMRMVQDMTGIPTKRQREVLTEAEFNQVTAARAAIDDLKLTIDDNAAVSVADIKAEAQRAAAIGQKPALILVDYLQLMGGGKAQRKNDNREQELAAISRGLKQTAREVGCVVAALSQLSRQCEARNDKRPILSDLRESGAIEQDADLVMFIYRDEYYNPQKAKPGHAEAIIAKHRNGPVGTVDLKFEAERTRFTSPAYGEFDDVRSF